MSDTYEIEGVTVTPLGGGHYELAHSSLPEPEKIRGKEDADARAAEIGKAAKPADGSMEPQGQLGGVVIDEQAAAKDAEIAALKAQLAEAAKRNAAFEEAAKSARTVLQDGESGSSGSGVPHSVPRSFNGEMDSKTKSELKKMGITTSKIVLEENEDIPPTGLYLGHNGRGYMLSPGEPVDVPDFLLGVLDDAVTSSPVVDSKTRKVLGYRNRMKYPYRRV